MLYGRDAEWAHIEALLDAGRASNSSALLVVGEPGIGKTALLEHARERAADMEVLAARGVESESDLPFAALHQLLRPALTHIAELPEQQADALRGALGIGPRDLVGEERFLAFAGCLSLLSELSEQRPVLCLVDDAQWLDSASADALRFVARRLDGEGVTMLFGVREGQPASFSMPEMPAIRLEGLDAEAAQQLLAQETSTEADRGVVDRLLAQTGGNPLALIELPSRLTPAQLSGDEPLPSDLPLTRQVERVFLEHVRRLSPDTQRLLLIAAADDSENAALVARAAGGGESGLIALDAAEQAGLVSVDGARLTFRHPLVRSAVYGAATSMERREAHRSLADALTGDDEQFDRRAWHVAAATLEPDETVAAALDVAATHAQRRAAYGAAVRALERAAELSTNRDSRGRRLVDAARCASVAAADAKAASLAEQARTLIDGDPVRAADLARALGLADIRRGKPANAASALLAAAEEVCSIDPERCLDLLLDAAWAAGEAGDVEAHAAISRLAGRLADSHVDSRSTFIVALLTGLGAVADGDLKTAFIHLTRAVAIGADDDDPVHVVWAGSASMALGDERKARVLYERAAALARARGNLGFLAPALGFLSLQRFAAQRFDQAAAAAAEAEQFAREVGAENLIAVPHFVLAAVAAIRGHDDEAIRRADACFELARAHDLPAAAVRPVWALALLDLGRGRWAEAFGRLESISHPMPGLVGVIAKRILPDRIEAAVRAGQIEAARGALDVFEQWAPNAGAPWIEPRLASCRALVAAGDEATRNYEEAVRLRADALPFDLARIHLLYGEHLRRERRRTDSRVHFRAALEMFVRHGATPWAERAQAELRASGETPRRRSYETRDQLTPQEVQISQLVAAGLSNKEIAAQLFLSPRTIETHLRNVYSKLSISSRTQLARLQLAEDDAVVAATSPSGPRSLTSTS